MRKIQACCVIVAVLISCILSCGIPTSMPILPKEVTVKAKPSVSVPLGRVHYNLYSGLSGGDMDGGKGSLNDILGASWRKDLEDRGITLYDYRPSNVEDDNVQKFLVHYRLDMEDILGSSGEFDLSEYQEMLDGLTGKPTEINPVTFDIPSIDTTDQFNVEIPLGEVIAQIDTSIGTLDVSEAYLPVTQGSSSYVFPYDVSILGENSGKNFSITLQGLKSLVLATGTLNFDFTLRYGSPPQLEEGSTLTLSGFELRADEGSEPIKNVTAPKTPVVLQSHNDTGSLAITFKGTELPEKFDLVCKLDITGVIAGSDPGYFELEVKPDFTDYVISGARDLLLTKDQIASLAYTFPETTHDIGGSLGPSFSAVVKEGSLEIDISKLFPPIDASKPGDEGWNLALDLSELRIEQQDSSVAPGLSLGGQPPLHSGDNDLSGERLNRNSVIIKGKVNASIPNNKLTFQNFPGGILKSDQGVAYKKQVDMNMTVSLLSDVTVLAEDFGLDAVNQNIEQKLGDDFIGFKEWLNYIEFQRTGEDPPDYGLGLVLEIEMLNIVGGLGLYINAPDLGLNNVFQPLANVKDPEPGKEKSARLIFINEDSGGYKLRGSNLPETLSIDVKLGLQDTDAQAEYVKTGILALKDVEPGKTVEIKDARARLLFDWTKMSIKPKPHTSGGSGDSLPDYPFAGTFPDKDKGEEGIDLSSMPKGLSFYLPDEAEGEGLKAQLYISLKRKILNTETGEWVEDPETPGYDEDDPGGWRKNLQVNLPSLKFYFRHGDDRSDNLFTYEPDTQKDTGDWTLSRSITDILKDLEPEFIMEDVENEDNPFMIYAAPSLPEQNKAIPLGNFAKALNDLLSGRKEGPLFFEYEVGLADVPAKEEEEAEEAKPEPGEILLYPDMLTKKIVASVDLLLLVPLILRADSKDGAPVIISIDPDAGDADLFQRKNPDDNEYFDMVKSFGFDIAIKNMAGLNAGKLFLENKIDVKKLKYRLPLVDFANPSSNHLSLDSGEMEKIKAIWPFIPQASIEFEPDTALRIERNFNIELQSITVKADGEYTFETGL